MGTHNRRLIRVGFVPRSVFGHSTHADTSSDAKELGLVSRNLSLSVDCEVFPELEMEQAQSLFTEPKRRYLWWRDLGLLGGGGPRWSLWWSGSAWFEERYLLDKDRRKD